MNVELFIARRLFSTGKGKKRISKPAVLIAQWGVAVGLLVMILSVCIVVGFKHQVREKIVGFGQHIQVRNYEGTMAGETPVTATDSLLRAIEAVPMVNSSHVYAGKPGLIAAGDEFDGIMLKGVAADYDLSFFANYLIEGEIPTFSDTATTGALLLSKPIADKMQVEVGDKVNIYFVQNNVKARRFTIKGLYRTNLSEMDNLMALTDIYTIRRLNGWEDDKCTGIEVSLSNYDALEVVCDSVASLIDKEAEKNYEKLYVRTVEEMNPALFAWLDILDSTVWVIMVLVLAVAGFTMISGLLILILEKSNFIGILKAIGSKDISIRRIFLYYAMFIIGKGMLWGNIMGFAIALIQYYFGIVKLDAEMYYMDIVPIEFTWWLLPLNIAMFLLSTAMLVLPSMLISHIEPTKAIRFE
jgi:lipoprotein-releasing system permease protein